MRMRAVPLLALLPLAACEPWDPVRAADHCEERARAAQGPTGRVVIGANSEDGFGVGGEIGLTTDFLTGRDPIEVYNECVYDLTGQAPIRPPRLR